MDVDGNTMFLNDLFLFIFLLIMLVSFWYYLLKAYQKRFVVLFLFLLFVEICF